MKFKLILLALLGTGLAANPIGSSDADDMLAIATQYNQLAIDNSYLTEYLIAGASAKPDYVHGWFDGYRAAKEQDIQTLVFIRQAQFAQDVEKPVKRPIYNRHNPER